MDANAIWGEAWEAATHQSEDQQKRLNSGKAVSCTPHDLDKERCCAKFHGRRGIYETYLDYCTCTDFARRQLPCKHIYRLAIELGVMNGNVSSYAHGGYSWKEAVEIIEKYPEAVQEEFCLHLGSTKADSAPYRRMKCPEMETLIKDGILIEYPEKETAKYKTVVLIKDFLKDRRSLQRYFNRKHRKPNVFNGDYMEYEPLPDDEISAFLHQRGFCLDIPVARKSDFDS